MDDIKYVPWGDNIDLAKLIATLLAPCPELPPIGPMPTKVGNTKAGVNDARKVECGKSKFHGFRPANEPCPMCDPDVAGPAERAWRNGQLVFG